MDALVFGDSTLVVALADGTHEAVTDDRLAHVAEQERRAYRERLAEGHGYDDVRRRLLADLTAEERRHRNKDDGYWIASTDPVAAHHAIVRSWDRADVVTALLLTDGAAAIHDRYHLVTGWAPVLELAQVEGPSVVIDAVREAERSDPTGQRWLRSKPHDDATCVLVGFPSSG